jgi:hypothetical protein
VFLIEAFPMVTSGLELAGFMLSGGSGPAGRRSFARWRMDGGMISRLLHLSRGFRTLRVERLAAVHGVQVNSPTIETAAPGVSLRCLLMLNDGGLCRACVQPYQDR